MKQPNPQRRLQLIRAAAKLFREKGYERTTVRDLAAAVGLQSGSLFHHFSSKEAILFAVIEEALETTVNHLQKAVLSSSDVKTRLKALIKAELESILGETREGLAVTFFEWRGLSEEHRAWVDKMYLTYKGVWQDVLGQAEREGHLPIDAQMLRRFLRGALSWTVSWYKEDRGHDLDYLASQALDMFWRDA